jgi:hypothetical protein
LKREGNLLVDLARRQFRRWPLALAFALDAGKRAAAIDLAPDVDPVLPLALSAMANGIGIVPDAGEKIRANVLELIPVAGWGKLYRREAGHSRLGVSVAHENTTVPCTIARTKQKRGLCKVEATSQTQQLRPEGLRSLPISFVPFEPVGHPVRNKPLPESQHLALKSPRNRRVDQSDDSDSVWQPDH